MTKSINIKNILIVFLLLLIMIGILSSPEDSMESAKEGLYIWINLLLPSLFPFIFISNLLISFKFVEFLGKILEPIMRPLFRVSGSGIFPFLISVISGYPVGAKLSANLRDENLISQEEGNRSISFSSTSGPLFILGTVMIGMLGINAPIFLIPHYLGVITVGLFFRFYKKNSHPMSPKKLQRKDTSTISLGNSMGHAVKDSMNSMLLIGGYVIIFTVIINLVLNSDSINALLHALATRIKISPSILRGLLAGIIELTNGCYIISNLNIDLIYKILIINFLIGWGGFSINSQAISFISQTDLNIAIYTISKLFHGILSTLYTYIIYIFFYRDRLVPTFIDISESIQSPDLLTWFQMLKSSMSILFSGLMVLIILSLLIRSIKK